MLKKTLSAFLAGFVLTVIVLSQISVSASQVSYKGYKVPVDINVNGKYLEDGGKGYLDTNGVIYVPVRYASEALGATVTWDAVTSTAAVTKGSSKLVFVPADNCCYINDYWNYAPQKLENGTLYTDAYFIFKSLGGTVEVNSQNYEIKVSIPEYTVPDSYIEKYYNEEDLYWLSRIVTCESGSVSFEAKVMVANVILNRRESNLFPNTVYDVIYDTKHGVQFPPAQKGNVVKAKPTADTIVACRAALNGLDLAPDCLYFTYSTNKTGWVARTRILYKVLGRQAFYK
ncbi:MAG: cell wall hydrolase [Clostridia bacterium]|nr:cell wall hydrolase [Clostridia bacterium]